jgi:hypothetical protein
MSTLEASLHVEAPMSEAQSLPPEPSAPDPPTATIPPETPPDLVLDRLRRAFAENIPGLAIDQLPGTTLEELEASYASARAAFEAGKAAAVSAPQVPAGAPGRTTASPGSPHARILAGLRELEVTSRA